MFIFTKTFILIKLTNFTLHAYLLIAYIFVFNKPINNTLKVIL